MATCARCGGYRTPYRDLLCPACRAVYLQERPPLSRQLARQERAEREFAGLPTLHRNCLRRSGYWTAAQVAAVPDVWLRATVKRLGARGVEQIRAVIPEAG